MREDPSPIQRLARRLPPWGWLLVALVSLLLAGGSATVLLSRLNDRQKDEWVRRLEAVRLFAVDTYRLTFLRRLPGGDRKPSQDLAVHVAPHGTLDPQAHLAGVDRFEDDVVENSDDRPPPPVAPPQTLDPAWKPVFSGAFSDS